MTSIAKCGGSWKEDKSNGLLRNRSISTFKDLQTI